MDNPEITQFLSRVEKQEIPAEQLLPVVYDELRRVAAHKMAREAPGNTLQATALVHEAWVRVGGAAHSWQNRVHFFSAAAEAMRRILIDRARSKAAHRHGGQLDRVDLQDLEIAAPMADQNLLALDDALQKLEAHDAQKAQLVKLRYFAGLTLEDAAETLGISAATAKRYWSYSRAWLFREIARARND